MIILDFKPSYEIDRYRWTLQMIERTKSFITWSALMFDLQHSKSNSPKRILTFFKKTKRISFNAAFQTKQVWHSYVFNVDVCHVLQEKGELISVCSKLKVLIFRSKLGYWTSFEILYHFGWNWMKKGCACHQNMKLVMRACQI